MVRFHAGKLGTLKAIHDVRKTTAVEWYGAIPYFEGGRLLQGTSD